MDSPKIKRALISVSDKMGLAAFAKALTELGVEIYSTGGTRKHLLNEKIPVIDVSEYTGFPEMMDGRLKTLHPKVHGGILCRRDNIEDMNAVAEHKINCFELVVVNLYPFEATVAHEGVTDEEAIENIDIGGPTMVRAAAKNHKFVTIVTSPEQYSSVLDEIKRNGSTTLQLRRSLAKDAFTHTGAYDTAISQYFIERSEEGAAFPASLSMTFSRGTVLRYGENPHQQAAVYVDKKYKGPSVVTARQLNGKELSYNNILDIDSALAIVRGFREPAVAVLKHNNPCGAAIAATASEAVKNAMEGDPMSAFGSVIGFNCPVDKPSAEYLATPGLFVEAIVAPEFLPDAIEILKTQPKWKENVRLLQCGQFGAAPKRWAVRPLEGGALYQEADVLTDPESEWTVVTEQKPTAEQMNDLRFAWELVRHVKSNAITVAKNRMLLGAGAGQMSRVDSVEVSLKKAGNRVKGAVLASDAFFPFPDSIELAAANGVVSIIQPGGSRKDDASIEACNKYGLSMIFTGRRHFKH
ncbi:MAG: bifunctional phosphoribosylaminoimidazolecarboxamide formyltransferase/IMP cyclohydrolase [Planctomycetaceae bacterium]|jgi:phosphoribosylaminoimidazolecarboxamide formyltransferase/IMP cyclohydrolase|nr:bifunctional phosphoribosylaminoimidazolecarboxamide formyltransferase/IMP cyclohydrolase [Planctomycetaceae bacterium]